MTETISPQTPDEIVGKQILKDFVTAGLLPQSYADQMETALVTGKLQTLDWQLWAEKALELEKRGEL